MWAYLFPLFLLLTAPLSAAAAPVFDEAGRTSPMERLRALPPMQMDEVLWLARCIYSESDRTDEQRLVAWVVRNRVETQFRGATYRDVVLEAKQFSAFNTPSPRRTRILSLDQDATSKAWQEAVGIALQVYHAPATERPFSVTTRHFYSPVSMEGGRTPHWAFDGTPLSSATLGVDPNRFRFFDGVDSGEAGMAATDTPSPASQRIDTYRDARPQLRTRSVRFSGRVPRPTRPDLNRPARNNR